MDDIHWISPTVQIYVQSSCTTFIGAPLPQHLLLSCKLGRASTHGEPPLEKPLVMFMTTHDVHDHPWCSWSPMMFMTTHDVHEGKHFNAGPRKLGLDLKLWHITHYWCACFLEDQSAKYLSGAIERVYEFKMPKRLCPHCEGGDPPLHNLENWPNFWVCARQLALSHLKSV